jgi:hypothetical protein
LRRWTDQFDYPWHWNGSKDPVFDYNDDEKEEKEEEEEEKKEKEK